MEDLVAHITHVVLFKWREDAPEDAIEAAAAGLAGLADLVPDILELEVGRNFSERSQGYSLALLVRFPHRAALEAYAPHPAHQRVVTELIRPIAESVLVADYEA